MIEFCAGLLLGVAVGAWAYRYALRRDPDKLEEIAAAIRAAKRRW
jgi:hypothetical protein